MAMTFDEQASTEISDPNGCSRLNVFWKAIMNYLSRKNLLFRYTIIALEKCFFTETLKKVA